MFLSLKVLPDLVVSLEYPLAIVNLEVFRILDLWISERSVDVGTEGSGLPGPAVRSIVGFRSKLFRHDLDAHAVDVVELVVPSHIVELLVLCTDGDVVAVAIVKCSQPVKVLVALSVRAISKVGDYSNLLLNYTVRSD